MSSLVLSPSVYRLLPPLPFHLNKETLIISSGIDKLPFYLDNFLVPTLERYCCKNKKYKGSYVILEYHDYKNHKIMINSYYKDDKIYLEIYRHDHSSLHLKYYYEIYHYLLKYGFKVQSLSGKQVNNYRLNSFSPLSIKNFNFIEIKPKIILHDQIDSLNKLKNIELSSYLKNAEELLFRLTEKKLNGWNYLVWWNIENKFKEDIKKYEGKPYQVYNLTCWMLFWNKNLIDWYNYFDYKILSLYQLILNVNTIIIKNNEKIDYSYVKLFKQIFSQTKLKIKDKIKDKFLTTKCIILPPPSKLVRSQTTY